MAFSKEQNPDIKQIFSKLRKSPMITFEVEKRTKSELLGKETKAPGTIYVSSNKFRWDTAGDEKSKIIYDGSVIWTIQDPPKGFKAPPQITKVKMSKKSEGQLFLNSLFQENFNGQFQLTKKEKIDGSWVFFLKPLKKNVGIEELKIKIGEERDIEEIDYVDEVQNKTSVIISKTNLSNKIDLKLFQYYPPKGSQVNEL